MRNSLSLEFKPVTLAIWADFEILFTEPGIQIGQAQRWCYSALTSAR